MKLIAEIDTADGAGTLRLSCDGETLTVGDVCVALAEFRDALNAVAPKPRMKLAEEIGAEHRVAINAIMVPPAPTRDASGARIGPSPRFSMRAVKPEANLEEPEDDGGTAA